ncbi:hypothetical protein [Streptomyces sp. A3M-1-3]|uniref:hypothetical protein n=1 Tax=Streptomyces sp. A3M-1-3 TaxID=2962044 RepID=UPI0035AC15F3
MSTQRPDEQRVFAEKERLRFPLLSDAELALTAALRLPTFRAAGVSRLKRLTLVIDRYRVVREVFYPVTHIEASVRGGSGGGHALRLRSRQRMIRASISRA